VVRLVFRGGTTFRQRLGQCPRLPPPLSAGLRDPSPRQRSTAVDAALSRQRAVRAALPHSTGTTCGGKKSDRGCGSLAVHCCPPRPSSASPHSGPRGPSIGPLAVTFVQVRATLLTLTPTFPTRFGPCDPAAKPGCLSWGCPKIAPPSYTIEKSDTRWLYSAVHALRCRSLLPVVHRPAPLARNLLRSASPVGLAASGDHDSAFRLRRVASLGFLPAPWCPVARPWKSSPVAFVALREVNSAFRHRHSPLGSSAPGLDPYGSAPWPRGESASTCSRRNLSATPRLDLV
jgi:hypothetical protein